MSVYARRVAAVYMAGGKVPEQYCSEWMARFGVHEQGPFDSKQEAVEAETRMWAEWLDEQEKQYKKRTENNEENT